jgi:enoyl-CoA hydratase/carnithine racemase
MPSELTYSKAERVGTVMISTGDGRNALSAVLRDDLRAVLAEAQADPGVRALVLTAAGENFCVDPAGEPQPDQELFGLLGVEATDALLDFDKPIVAGINGVAAGSGCDIAVCCDMRVAAETARIGTSQVQQGIVPGASIYFLPRIVRFGKACEMIFTGAMVDAREAADIGLFDHVVSPAQLAEAVQEIAVGIALGPPIAMRLTKRAIYRSLALNSEAAKEYTVLARSLGMHATEESREGFNSFNERRPPNF